MISRALGRAKGSSGQGVEMVWSRPRDKGLALFLRESFSQGAPSPYALGVSTRAWPKIGERVPRAPWLAFEPEAIWKATPSRVHLFGIPIDRVLLEEAVRRLEDWINRKTSVRLVLTPDTTALWRARWDSLLRAAYCQADLVTADGTGLIWASRLLGDPLPGRVTGIDLLERFCERAASKGYRLFLVGAKPGVAFRAACKLQERYAGLQIVGTRDGYFSAAEEAALIEEIRRAAPDLLLVGMGVPRQERWMLQHQNLLDVPVVMGVGGSFDVLSGQLPRAPITWQRWGLEWLWRALREPHRFWRARVIPLFLAKIFFHKLLQLSTSRSSS